MALHWDVSRVADKDTVCFELAPFDKPWDGIKQGDRVLKTRTHALIFLTMAIGIGTITTRNQQDVFKRVALIERMFGARVSLKGEDGLWREVPFTEADIAAHVGLHTNVSTEPFGKWCKRQFDNWRPEDFDPWTVNRPALVGVDG